MTESSLVLATMVVAVIGLVHLKDYVNRSEAMRAMDQLGRQILEYRRQHGSLPAESFVIAVKGQVEGAVRRGNVRYRALWIGPRRAARNHPRLLSQAAAQFVLGRWVPGPAPGWDSGVDSGV